MNYSEQSLGIVPIIVVIAAFLILIAIMLYHRCPRCNKRQLNNTGYCRKCNTWFGEF